MIQKVKLFGYNGISSLAIAGACGTVGSFGLPRQEFGFGCSPNLLHAELVSLIISESQKNVEPNENIMIGFYQRYYFKHI